MDNDVCLELRSDPRLLSCVRSLVRAWFEARGLDEEAATELVLAIDEACSNAIRHAYGGAVDCSLKMTLKTGEEFLEVKLCDEGAPCSADAVAPRPLEVPDPDQLRPGGLGVQLMHRTFDEVAFCPGRKRGNCVILRKRRPT